MNQLEIKNLKLKENNDFQEKEGWLDEKDVIKHPLYSRIISNPYQPDFIKKNLKTLISTKNEYFPYLFEGKCMCGCCTCGNCHCVHFKYKVNKDIP